MSQKVECCDCNEEVFEDTRHAVCPTCGYVMCGDCYDAVSDGDCPDCATEFDIVNNDED